HVLRCRERDPRQQGAERAKLRRRGKDDGAREPGDAGRRGRRVLDDLHHRRHVPDRSAGERSGTAGGIAPDYIPTTLLTTFRVYTKDSHPRSLRGKARAQKTRRGNEKGWVEMVSCRPRPEERAGEIVPPTRARMRASRRMRTSGVPSCFETHRRACSAAEGLALASRCDAPQHEGNQDQPAAVRNIRPLFPIVINNGFCNRNVFAALSLKIPITAMWSNRTMRRPAPWFRLTSAPRTRSYPPPCGEGGERSEPGGGGAVMLESRLKDGPPPPTPPHKGEGSRPRSPLE